MFITNEGNWSMQRFNERSSPITRLVWVTYLSRLILPKSSLNILTSQQDIYEVNAVPGMVVCLRWFIKSCSVSWLVAIINHGMDLIPKWWMRNCGMFDEETSIWERSKMSRDRSSRGVSQEISLSFAPPRARCVRRAGTHFTPVFSISALTRNSEKAKHTIH